MTETIRQDEVAAAVLESIAHNLCSLHDFDPAFVMGQEKFARAVITEYLGATRSNPAPATGRLDREAVARIIDPFIFTPEALVSDEVAAENVEGRRIAYAKADAILALPSSGTEGEK